MCWCAATTPASVTQLLLACAPPLLVSMACAHTLYHPTLPHPTLMAPPLPAHMSKAAHPTPNPRARAPFSPTPPRSYEFMYKQSVETTDTFLGMSGKDPSSTQCEDLVVKVHLPVVATAAGEGLGREGGGEGWREGGEPHA